MTQFNDLPYKYRIAVYFTALALILVVGWLWARPVGAFSTAWEDSFETYSTGDLNGQGNWAGGPYFDVVDTGCYEGSKCVKVAGLDFGQNMTLTPGETITTGTHQLQFLVKPTNYSYGYPGSKISFVFLNSDLEFMAGFDLMRAGTADTFCISNYNAGSCLNGAELLAKDAWVQITITIDFSTENVDVEAVSGAGTFTYTGLTDGFGINLPKEITKFKFYYLAEPECYIDDINIPIVPASVWATSPVSGTEITSLDTPIDLNWAGLGDYESVYVSFTNLSTGLSTGVQKFDIADIGESGTMELDFNDFNFQKNGRWYLHAIAVYQGYQIVEGQFLSGYGYVWTDDLTSGEYYIDLNIDGFVPIFEMTDWYEWYVANSAFDEPTGLFTAIAGFLGPIYSTIGEFASRVSAFFDTGTAYSKGYALGTAIPLGSYYSNEVLQLIGNPPIIQYFLIIIAVLLGIGILKLVLRFLGR
jgi:hypothetical protein